MAIPPTMFPTVAEALASVGPQRAGPDRRREAVRARPDLGTRAERHAAHTCSPRSASSASTTTSARRASRTCSCSASRTRCSSRSGTATTCAACRSRCRRRSGSRAAAASTTASARSATCCRTTSCRSSSLLAMEPPVGPSRTFLQDEKAKVFAAMRPIDPHQVVRGQYVGYRDEPGVGPGLDDRDVRRRAARDRLVAVGRRALVRPRRQGARRSRPPRPSSSSAPPRLLFDEAGGPEPGRNLVRLRLGKRRRGDVHAAGQDARPAPRQPERRRRRRLRGRARRTARGLRAPARAMPSPGRRAASPARTSSSRRGGSSSRRSTTRARCTRTSAGHGARPRPTASSTATTGSPSADPLVGGDEPTTHSSAACRI